ncbi:MAG: hypothetical protein HQM10_03680 [Candidatus Riflebacteria bacterium]|nr:hypothetical protein [Candidatus Riflebacteria bacterium]
MIINDKQPVEEEAGFVVSFQSRLYSIDSGDIPENYFPLSDSFCPTIKRNSIMPGIVAAASIVATFLYIFYLVKT